MGFTAQEIVTCPSRPPVILRDSGGERIATLHWKVAFRQAETLISAVVTFETKTIPQITVRVNPVRQDRTVEWV